MGMDQYIHQLHLSATKRIFHSDSYFLSGVVICYFLPLIPLGFPIGNMVGVESFKDSVFSKISTISSSGLYLRSISVTGFFVTPSNTTRLGF